MVDKVQPGAWRSVFAKSWQEKRAALESSSLLRRHRTLESEQAVNAIIDGREMLNFSSNDYLGLAASSLLKEAAIDAVNQFGVGSGASHLVVGHHRLHEELCERVARFTRRDKALIFSSGYMANLAAISAVISKGDLVLQDKLNHASLIDGGLLSGARFQRYLHNDVQSLDRYLSRLGSDDKKSLVVTDGVFSMDGDTASLSELSEACQRHQSLLMVDDAHGIGVQGDEGRGSVIASGLTQESVPILVGTFGKAVGTSGAFVAGPTDLIDHLLQVARPYIYTTAIPPAIAAATITSLNFIEQADEERTHLRQLIEIFRTEAAQLGLSLLDSESPIQPIIIGASDQALALSQFLEARGILVGAIRPPTVPPKTARLRVTLSAAHAKSDVAKLIECLSEAKQHGLFERE